MGVQQYLSANTLTDLPTNASNAISWQGYCFSDIWDKRNARFEPCFLPIITLLPAVVSIAILLFNTLKSLVPWRPRWSQTFVQDTVDQYYEGDLRPKHRRNGFLFVLMVTSLFGLATELVLALTQPPKVPTIAEIGPPIPWVIVMILLVAHRPRKAPITVLAVFITQAATKAIVLGTDVDRKSQFLDGVSMILSTVGSALILFMPLRDSSLPVKDISRPGTEPTSALRSPEDNLTLFQFMTVSWMSPLMHIGSKRQLQDEDVWSLAYEFQHQRLHEHFRMLDGTVIRRLLKANAIDLYILVGLGILEKVMQYSAPLLLQLLLSSMEDIKAPKRSALTYAALSMVVRLIAAQSGVFSLWFGRRCYERSRGEMITMLYEKTLGRKVSFAPQESDSTRSDKCAGSNGNTTNAQTVPGGQAHQKWWHQAWPRIKTLFRHRKTEIPTDGPASMGKILNLMRNDVYEVAQRFWEFQDLITKPLSAIFSIALVVRLLGWPSMIAVLAMIVAQGINVLLARIMVHFEKKRRLATDKKLQLISQFVEAIRHLRWYGWESAWLTQIMSARQKELNLRIVTSLWRLSIGFVNTLALDLTPVIAFFAYTAIAKQPLKVDIAFPAWQLFSMMTGALRDLPNLVITLINAYVAVGRIEDFMAEPDKQSMHTQPLLGDDMALEQASFAWPDNATPTLRNISLSFSEPFSVVFGEVASGKSALLQALLGELDLLSGRLIGPHQAIGYCAQNPWLQSMSIRENILFSAPYEERRYNDVLYACALLPDLEEFPSGDLSLIGENGIGLSGGQRARVALARAIYSRTEILLLDDPLSALDQQTAEAIVERCFSGPLLEERTVVLATHRIDLMLRIPTQWIEMKNGRAFRLNPETFASEILRRATSTRAQQPELEAQKDDKVVAAEPAKFVEDEYRAQGGVKASIYWEYIKAGKLRWWTILVLFLVWYRVVAIGQSWWLKTWGEAYSQKSSLAFLVHTRDIIAGSASFLDDLPSPDTNIRPWLIGFAILAGSQSITFIFFQTMILVVTYTAGKNMFISIMNTVAGATFRFYDVTPIGRLMNRMTSDIGVIDGNISGQLHTVTWLGISWIGSLIVVGSITPTFLVFAVLLTIAFLLIFMRFIPTSQSLRRLEMVSLTPLMSNFGALLNGLTTVRAFCAQKQFQRTVIGVVDTFQKMDHFYWSLQAWLMYRYDALSATTTFLITILALATDLSAGLTAFVLIAAGKLVQSTHYLCKQYGQLQMEFVSVERVVELNHLEQEPKGDIEPPAWWPSFSSDIVFENVIIRYAEHLEPALRNLSFTIKGGSKTAILGRTGSGKSTLALAMLATIAPEAGRIIVDNIDLAKVDKHLLRTRITFLAQDPVLFPGTIRQNLDPVDEHSERECQLVLDRVCARQGWDLSTAVEAGGRNLSQGQRQLVGLARAVLRRSVIIILDEATASIDRETAMQIQQVMFEEMKNSTVITIAHRLEAVKNADYCVVLGKGEILEQGPAGAMLGRYEDQDEE